MQTRSSSRLTRDQSSKQKVENSNLEEHLPPVVMMADNRTMAELLCVPTKGYAEAIVVPPILTEQFEFKHSLINMMITDQFFGHEKDNPHDHIHQDSLNAAAGGNLLERSTQDELTIIENKSKQTSDVTTAMTTMLKQLHATPPPAPVKAVEEICVTCEGAYPYYQCLDAGGNTFLEFRDNIQGYVSAAAVNYNQGNLGYRPQGVANQIRPPATTQQNQNFHLNELEKIKRMNEANMKAMQTQIDMVKNELRNEMKRSIQTSFSNQTNEIKNMMASLLQMNTASTSSSGTLPSNAVTNPKSDLNAITTRSGVSYDGPLIPPPAVKSKPVTSKPANTPVSASKPNPKASIPYPSGRNDERNREKAKDQIKKFYQIFKDMSFEISFADALILMPKFASTLKALIGNKEKLSEMAQTPLNEHCSAVLLKKLPEKLGHPIKFLILCDFLRMAKCLALADLGASINLMPYSMWKKLSLPELTPACMSLELADHLISRPIGVAEDVYVKVGSFHFSIDFIVADFDADPREVLGFYDTISSGNPTPCSDPIISVTSSTLTPFETNDFLLEEVDAFLAIEDEPTSPQFPQSYLDPEGDILLLEAFLNDDPSSPPPNQRNYMPEVSKELKICKAKTDKSSVDEPPVVELKVLPPHLEYAFLEGDDKLLVIIAKDLSVEEKTALIMVLKSHKQAIAWKLSDIKGGFTVVENEENELIPLCLVTGWRVCIDCRKLNKATRKDHFPLPFKDQMLERLAGNQYYCFLDGFSGYSQIPIDPKDQEKTTFTCPYGTFAYRRMPFGLCNALGTFKRCMMAIFHDMIEKTMEEKSHFMVREGIVLGHKISKKGIEVDKAKVDVIFKLPHTTTIKGIRSFLGHAGFYRRFIKDFSKIARPITRLLEKDTPFIFSQECVDAFQTLKRMLTEAPILIAPNWDMPFELMCDASDFAIGAVLGPRRDKHFRPIHYASKTMTEAESKYTTTKKEMRCVASQEAIDIVKACHSGPIGGYHGPNYTARKLVYRKACHLPVEFEHKAYWALKHANFDLKTAGDHRKIQINKLNELRDQAYDNSLINKEKTIRIHDSKIKNRVFNVGDRVLLFNSRLKIFSGKLKSRWSGPFTISQVFPYGTVELSQPNGPKFKVNGHRIKHYFGEDIPQSVVLDL
nr:DNA-directed DNA polymerase [Tanacetum cinerariifolium]